ncbi:GLPGLI family protein [Chryseobacterium sp.]|uniref:GLPGLI family protein n=1 Tax=Chryseobacterium sp. TaxID=1871047 RepID=UPI0011CA6DBE|nr:GLPGLI family protein [Chryseobacterium sp.]TXF77367.1 GLPGLI family protein [Chryseobacterium sp.]
MHKFYITISFLTGILSFGQNKVDSSYLQCKYQMIFLVDTLDVSTTQDELTSLLIGKNVSLFRSDLKIKQDSLTKKAIGYAFNTIKNGGIISPDFSNIKRAKFQPEVYRKNGIVKVYSKILNNVFVFEPINKTVWKLIDETKSINGYVCHKAVGKYGSRNIVAWYSKDITIPEGPYNFKGLPGLIIELYDEKKFYHFTLSYLQKEKLPITLLNDAIETTYEKYIKRRKDVENDPSGNFNAVSRIPVSKEDEKRLIQRMKHKNNYLD